jgi:hypothetical protein
MLLINLNNKIMKNILQKLLLPLFVVLAFYSCRPDDFKDLGAPAAATSSLAGTWKLNKVLQTDEDAKNKGFTYAPINIQQMDVTSIFPYTDFKFTLNMNGNTPSTFSTTPGNAPKIIKLASGNWVVDDPNYPKVISMINGTDTAKITLGAYPMGATPILKVTSEKRDAATGKLLISYTYEFTKQ